MTKRAQHPGPTTLHTAGETQARRLINAGDFNATAPWSFSAADGNVILGDPDNPDWNRFAKWHLGKVTGEDPETRQAWKFPYGKRGRVFRSALRAIRVRASQAGATTIFEGVGRLMELMDEKTESSARVEIEKRIFSDVELRVEAEDDKPTLSGYAALFESQSEGLPFIEKIRAGAFSDSIKSDDVVALFNHDSNLVLGRKSSGTLHLEEDKRGLKFSVDLPDTSAAKDLRISVDRGDVKGASFGFLALQDRWDPDEKGEDLVRTIIKAKLFDVSPATFPAYPETIIAARSRDHWLKQHEAATSPWRRELARRRLDIATLSNQ